MTKLDALVVVVLALVSVVLALDVFERVDGTKPWREICRARVGSLPPSDRTTTEARIYDMWQTCLAAGK